MRIKARVLWEKIKRVAEKVGSFQARVLLTFTYFVLVAPFALVVRRWSDPLAIKGRKPPTWHPRNGEAELDREWATRQY